MRERRLRDLVESLAPEENRDYNLEIFQGPDVDLDRVVGACETLPMLAPRRVVAVYGVTLRHLATHDGLVAYLRRPNPSTVLLIGADEGSTADKAETRGKAPRGVIPVSELLELIGSREQFGVLTQERAMSFANSAARTRGARLARDAAEALIELCGTDAARLDDEIEKACLYTGGRGEIRLEDVEAVARRTRTHTVFELTNALAVGDRDAVLKELGVLMDDGTDALALVGMIAWQLRGLLKGAAAAAHGAAPAEISRAGQAHWKVRDRFVDTARRLGPYRAAHALVTLREVDRQLKSTAEAKRRLLERALLELLPR